MSRALYMVVERFKNKDAVAALEGLVAISSSAAIG